MTEDNALAEAQATERKWFARTLMASVIPAIAFAGITVARILAQRAVDSLNGGIPLEALPDEQLDQVHSSTTAAFLLFSASGILLVVSGSLFLGFLVRWLLALRAKRRVEALASN
jgi:hypothetical protein